MECAAPLLRPPAQAVSAEPFGDGVERGRRVIRWCFPEQGAGIAQRWLAGFPRGLADERLADRSDEAADLLALLLEHGEERDGLHTELHADLARWVALSSTGDRHLWEDMALPSRQALSALFARYFPGLHAKNTGNMRWKRFLYKQLCERAEIFACKSPSCGSCSDYALCFAPAADGIPGEPPWIPKP